MCTRSFSANVSHTGLVRVAAAGLITLLISACAAPPVAPPGAAAPAAGTTPQAVPTVQATEPPVREAAAGKKVILELWYPFAGDTLKQWETIFKAYEAEHPDIGIKAVFAANDLSTNSKLFTAIAGGRPPDITFVDGPQVVEWAARGVLEPLDEYIQTEGINKDDWWAPCWNGNIYEGKTWAIPQGCQAVFGFFWNKQVFKDAGLDPEKPPTTVEELEKMGETIAKVNEGRIDRLAYIPWSVYGPSNSMLFWGYTFGGDFYDPQTKKITANHPNNVKALEWMTKFAEKYSPERISGFQAGFGTGEQNPFYQGKMAMAPFGPWEITSIQRYAPNLEYGMTLPPIGFEGGKPGDATWAGGWAVGMPKGAKNPQEAFKFIKWFLTSDVATPVISFPAYKKAIFYNTVQDDPQLKVFYDLLVNAKRTRPVTPATAFYMGSLARAVDAAIYGKKTPQQALDDATAETQKELDRILAEGASQ